MRCCAATVCGRCHHDLPGKRRPQRPANGALPQPGKMPLLLAAMLTTGFRLAFFALLLVSLSRFADARGPNMVFIMADDLGYGEVGCYGQKQIKTPNIDRLAAEGIRFTDYYAGSTVCAPSRCVLMTGRHTGHARIRGNGGSGNLRTEDLTFAKILQAGGYSTGMFGKWGLGQRGRNRTAVQAGV